MDKFSKLKCWKNYVEGTRQNDSVTSGEGVALFGKPYNAVTESGIATGY